MINREKYLKELALFQDKDVIKVITGVRRCGKSTILDLMKERLRSQGVEAERLISFKMESMEFDSVQNYRDLYTLISGRIKGVSKPYLFLDELQEVEGWEKVVNALRVDFDCDIYITGSNAFLLSSEIATLLSGRYVEIPMLPLTFEEYLLFRGIVWQPGASAGFDKEGHPILLDDVLEQFKVNGGFPFLSFSVPSREEHRLYMKSLYDTVLVRDILQRARRKGRRNPENPQLLDRTCRFLSNNIGNETSLNSMTIALQTDFKDVANETVRTYAHALQEAYLFYHVDRYDLKGKELLKTNGKNYIVDLGIRSYLEGYRNTDSGRALENIVYLQLLFDGWEVTVGKLRAGEIDFVATKDEQTVYIQVTDDMRDEETQERELKPLRAVKSAFPKVVIVRTGDYPADYDGIRVIKLVDFLLHSKEL